MKLFCRHILTVIALLFYWPGLFILTHIPLPVLPLFPEIRVSDKVLHYLAYFVLVFLLWFAISPNAKVNWRKAAVWWILFVIIWYGAFDEWLQGYVGRSPDIKDFFADSGGTITGLFLLTIFSFWSAALIVTGGIIFVFTNFAQVNPADLLVLPAAVFFLFAYVLFTVLWMRWMHHFLPVRIPEFKWLIGALSLPAGFMLTVELFSLLVESEVAILNVIVSAAGILGTVVSTYLAVLFRHKFTGGFSSGGVN